MAEYYTQVSFSIPMTEAQFKWLYALHTANVLRLENWGPDAEPREPVEGEDPTIQVSYDAMKDFDGGTGIEVDWEGGSAWLYGEESVDCDYVAYLIHQFMVRFDIREPISFEFSMTCSRPRLDAFGGGAFIVTKDEIKSMSGGDWIRETLARMKEGVG